MAREDKLVERITYLTKIALGEEPNKDFNELYRYRMLYNAAFFNLLPKELVHKSKRHHDGEECFGGGWFIVMANLPTGQISNHYELKDWDLFQIPERGVADEWDGHTPQEAANRLHKYLLKEQGDKKPAIEPKFKVGDWIVFNGLILHIDEIVNGYYRTTSIGDGIHNSYDWDVDRCTRLWTIADAKDGDVLYLQHEGMEHVIIYKRLVKKTFHTILSVHCAYDGDSNDFFEDVDHYHSITSERDEKEIHPATKEQRDLLFRKMKEAGYEWDSEKKELKKIEVASKESEDERIRKWCISHFKACINVIKDNDEYKEYLSNKVIAWLEKQGEQTHALSQQEVTKTSDQEPHAHPDIDVRTMAAWQSGYKEAIEKACEWLSAELDKEEERHYIHVHGFDKERREIFLEDFRKAMKGGEK